MESLNKLENVPFEDVGVASNCNTMIVGEKPDIFKSGIKRYSLVGTL